MELEDIYKNIKRAGIILYNSNNELLMVKGRIAKKWGFPKGKLEINETFLNCAKREFKEETNRILDGTEKQIGKFIDNDCLYFIYKINHIDLLQYNIIYDINEIEDISWFNIHDIILLNNINRGVNKYIKKYIK
jgi:8-oxo-dGTP pyrophosphatase MutT (NUDIX family)